MAELHPPPEADPLQTDAAKIMRFGGVAIGILSTFDLGFKVLEVSIEAMRSMSLEQTSIGIGEDVGGIAVGALLATWGAQKLDAFNRRHSGRKTV